MDLELKYKSETGLPSRKRNTGNSTNRTNEFLNWVEEQKQNLMKISLDNAKIILKESGLPYNDNFYALRLYEMQFKIYEQLKLTMGIE